MQHEELDLDREVGEPVSVPMKYRGEEYVLCEASADAASRFRNTIRRSIETDNENNVKRVIGDGVVDSESQLIADCLFKVQSSSKSPVPVATVRSWPDRAREKLYRKVLEMSPTLAADKKEELLKEKARVEERLRSLERNGSATEQAKNSPSATTTTSA